MVAHPVSDSTGSGTLWHALLGLEGDAHFNVLHVLSNVFIFAGFILLALGWCVLHEAQKHRRLATEGIYARLRHSQYQAFIVIVFGFLLQWPTIPTLAMFPILVYVCVRLARREEQIAIAEFGEECRGYTQATPGFIPDLQGCRHSFSGATYRAG